MASPQVVELRVTEAKEFVVIELLADSEREQRISYDIEVIGLSRSRHSGQSTVGPGTTPPISRIRISHSGDWCASVDVREENGTSYTLEAGPCSQAKDELP